MPSKSSASTVAASKPTVSVPSVPKQTASGSLVEIEKKLDLMLEHLHNLDRRDRLRTIGGTIRGVLGLIPLVVLLLSVWYAYAYGEELLQKIIEQSTKQAALMVPSMSTPSLDELQEYFRQRNVE